MMGSTVPEHLAGSPDCVRSPGVRRPCRHLLQRTADAMDRTPCAGGERQSRTSTSSAQALSLHSRCPAGPASSPPSPRFLSRLARAAARLAQAALLIAGVVGIAAPASATAPTASAAEVTAAKPKEVVITFSEELATGSVPDESAFAVKIGANAGPGVSSVAIDDTDATKLKLGLEVALDASQKNVEVDYTKPGSNPLKDTDGNEVATFTRQAVTNNAPACPGTASQGTPFWSGCVTIGRYASLMVGYVDGRFGKLSETSFTRSSVRYELDGIVEQYPIGPYPRAFLVSFAGDPRPAAKNWTLLFGDSPVLHFKDAEYRDTDRSYKWTISTSRLGLERAGDKVSVHLIPGSVDAPPKLSGAPVVDGATLELVFDENLNTGSVPAKAAFDVEVVGSDRALASANPVAVSGRSVTLTLSSAAGYREKVTVAYAKPASNPLEDGAGNDVVNFDVEVVNETPNPRERGLVFAPASVTVPEGGSATYTVTLDRAPEAGSPVYVRAREIKASYPASDKLKISPVGFLLDTTNWNTGKEFTVSALRDGDGHDNRATLKHGGVRVRGGYTENLSGSAHVEVTMTDVNAPPRVANPIPNQSLVAGRSFSYTFPEDTFHDANDDPLSYNARRSFAAWPGWLAFDGPTRTFSGMPGRADTGFYQIYVYASDGVAHRAPYTQDMFYFRVYESLQALLEGRRLRPARGGLRSWSRSAEGPPGGCRVEVSVRFVAPDGTTIEVAELTAGDFAVDNGRLGTPVRSGDGWRVEASADPGFTGLMRVRLRARELAEAPEPDDEEAEPQVSEADSQAWAGSEQVFRVASDTECAPVARTALAGLALEGMVLEPAFDSDTYRYRVTVPNFVTNATLDARAVYEAASVSISLDDDDEEVAGHQVALSDAFQVRVTVTAGEETRSYLIEGSPPEVAALTGFVLVNASTDADLGAVSDGGTVSVSANGIHGIRAGVAAGADVGSVVLSLAGPGTDDRHEQTESIAPYSLFGDADGAEHGRALAAGSYTLGATAWSESGGTGDELGTLSVSFTVEVEAAPVTPPPAGVLTGFVLLDASDQSTVAALANGADIDLEGRSGASFAIRADVAANATLGSVALSLSGAKTVSRTENYAPYSLWGDRDDGNGGRALDGASLPAGRYTLSATAHAERRASGSTLGTLSVSFEVLAPAALSVADAQVQEGPGATLDFAVTLDRSSTGTVTVAYATADGTATAGSDYTATSGTLTFQPGAREKTISVPVLGDLVDEGSETLTLTLSSASGATIADEVATGTITNSGPVQKMWLSRFGRTVGSQVVDAVSERLSAPLSGGEVTLAGQRLDVARMDDGAARAKAVAGLAQAPGGEPERGPEPDKGLFGSRARPHPGAGPSSRGLSGRELLLGSAFRFAAAHDGDGPGYAAWGRVTAGGFDAKEAHGDDTVRMDGEVTTGVLGADASWSRWLAGVAVSVSEGEGTYDSSGAETRGTVESTLTGVHPYARLQVSERVQAWGLLGFGSGEMRLRQAVNETRTETTVTRTDLEMRLGAVGARGALLEAGETGGLDLALKADAFVVDTEWDPVSNEPDTTAGSSRLRVAVEGSRIFALDEGAALTPRLELGLRHDGGDAETGTGIELGGRIGYANTASGLNVEASARTLLAHEESAYEEWGASGSVRIDPGASGRGLSLTVAPAIGAAASGVERLWSLENAQGLAAADEFEAQGRLSAELGYGLPVFGAFTGTPYAGFGLSDGERDWRVGWRLTPARPGLDLELGVEGTWAEPADDAAPAHGVILRGSIRW